MAPEKSYPNELTRFLRAHREPIVESWVARLKEKPELRKKLAGFESPEPLFETVNKLYDSFLVPLSSPTSTGRTRKVRLGKPQRRLLETFSLYDLQRTQILLLDALVASVRQEYAGKPRKIEKLTSTLTERMHDVLLQSCRAEQKRREKAGARAESKYARLLDMANDAIFLMNFDTGLFVEVNQAACRLTGYSEAELKQLGFNSLVSVFDLNLALERANAAIEEGAVRFDDLSIYTKRKKAVPVDISASAVTVEGVKHILAIVRSIKERKRYEEKIREKAGRLQLVNEIAQAISSADLDIEAVLTSILKSVSRVIKVEAGSILKLEDSELIFMAALGEKAEYVKPFRLKLGQGIAGWVAQTGESASVDDVHRDPRYYPEVERATGFETKSILAVPMKTRDTIVGVIELINKVGGHFSKRDKELIDVISSFAAVALEHARLYSECELAKAHFSEARSPMWSSKLAAVVAHEMKDPLGIIKNYVRILAERLASAGAEPEELGVISEETDRITKITDQLLHFSEAYAEEPKQTPLNLLVENSVTSMRNKLKSAGIETEVKLDRSLPHVSVIPNQMKLVFSNLLRLAMSEMPEGGTLTVATRQRDSSIWIEFSNTGTRHSGREATELFLPSAVAKGLVPKGLGLYMAYNIVQSYGGDIEVRPRKGKGSTFRIKMPLNFEESR